MYIYIYNKTSRVKIGIKNYQSYSMNCDVSITLISYCENRQNVLKKHQYI